MWAAPLCQTFLHLLYDKEILEEPMILQWYSCKHAGGEDGGLEPQRKQLREQVRHSCHVIRYICMSLRQSDSEIAFPPFLVTVFPTKAAVYWDDNPFCVSRYHTYFVLQNETLCSKIAKFYLSV